MIKPATAAAPRTDPSKFNLWKVGGGSSQAISETLGEGIGGGGKLRTTESQKYDTDQHVDDIAILHE